MAKKRSTRRPEPPSRSWLRGWLYQVSHGTVAQVIGGVLLAALVGGTGYVASTADTEDQRDASGPSLQGYDVEIEAAISVANVTAGDEEYSPLINAVVGDYVKFKVWYYNRENVDSGHYASQLTVRILPSGTRSTIQRIGAEVFGTNTNRVDVETTVAVPDGAVVRLLPDTGKWRHNAGNDAAPDWITEPVGPELIQRGAVLEDAPPCLACEATVTILGVVEQL